MAQGERPVADAERERTLRLLELAVGRGMLSMDEYTANSSLVLSVGTVHDLEAVLATIPGISSVKAFDDRPMVAKLAGQALVHSGNWSVPSEIALSGGNGRILLDFTHARFRSMTVVVDVELKSVRLKLVTPADVAVDLAQLNSTYTHIVNRSQPETDPFISVVLRGTSLYGSVVAKRAK